MTVTFTNTRRHLFDTWIYHLIRKQLIYLPLIVLCLFYTFVFLPSTIHNYGLILGIVVSIFYILIYILIFSLILILIIFCKVFFLNQNKNKGILTEHTITITDDEFIEETEVNKSINKWAGILKVKKTKKYLYIYISQEACHIIPISSFQNFSECNQFYGEISRRIKHS